MTDQLEKEQITAAFKRIRWLRGWLAGILISYFPMVFLFYLLRIPVWIFMTFCAVWVCGGIVIAFMIGFSVCPVCRQYFHVRGMEGSTFAKECLNCGISLKTD